MDRLLLLKSRHKILMQSRPHAEEKGRTGAEPRGAEKDWPEGREVRGDCDEEVWPEQVGSQSGTWPLAYPARSLSEEL